MKSKHETRNSVKRGWGLRVMWTARFMGYFTHSANRQVRFNLVSQIRVIVNPWMALSPHLNNFSYTHILYYAQYIQQELVTYIEMHMQMMTCAVNPSPLLCTSHYPNSIFHPKKTWLQRSVLWWLYGKFTEQALSTITRPQNLSPPLLLYNPE